MVTLYNNAKPRDRSFLSHFSVITSLCTGRLRPPALPADEQRAVLFTPFCARLGIENLSQISVSGTYARSRGLLDFVEGWVESFDQSEADGTMDELRVF